MEAEDLVTLVSGAALVWRFVRDDGTPASFIHRCFQQEFWRESSVRRRFGACASLLAWPIIVPALVGFFTWRNGREVRKRTGKSMLRQMREQTALTVTRSILPPWYYIFELHEDGKRRRAGEYLNRFETKRFAYEFLRRFNGGQSLPAVRSTPWLSNKALFSVRCRDYQLPAVPVLMLLENGQVIQREDDGSLPPHQDLFVKRIRGTGGRGAQRWIYLNDDRYQDASGRTLTESDLLEHLKALTLHWRKGCIVQPRLVNHRDIADLSNGALTTVRVMTCRNERDQYEVTNAAFRMAQGKNTVVDNFHAGGILAKVDIRTGVLGRATDGAMALSPGTGWCDRHPDTGGQILERRLPCWSDVIELARRAHATAFSDHVLIGWDIAILDDGPRLIEGNKGPDLDLVQRSHGEPIGNSRLGQLLAFHLQRSLEAKYAAASHVSP